MSDADLAPITNLKKLPTLSRKRDNFSRNDVIAAFQNAFEITGGVTRLILWANENYDEFMKIYARLLPSQAAPIGIQVEAVIQHRLAPSALDNHPGQVIDLQTGRIIREEQEQPVKKEA